jgi:RNA polymerase sigma-70 factor (ECF subfamily)
MDKRLVEFETLALPHLDAAYSLARWLARSPTDAEDVVQEAMLRAFRAFDSLRGEAVKPWLLAIVRNCFHDHVVKARRHRPYGEISDQAVDDTPTPEETAVTTSERRQLDRILALLPPDYREVLVLRELQDLSYREIADQVGVPIGTVMSRLARARTLLKDKWLAEKAQ